MSFRRAVVCTLFLLAALLAGAASGASAQPAGEPPASHAHARAPRDTTLFFPVWMHPWLEIGGGWLQSPKYMKHFYDSGQGLAAGIAIRPRSRFELRTSLDYQMLISHHSGNVIVDWGYTDVTGREVVDTLNYQFDSNAWNLTLRQETGLEVGKGLWLTGGLGAGYMNGGFEDNANIPGSGFIARPPVAMRNGWGWSWTAAARWDVDLDPAVPLGLELRTTGLRRGDTFVHWWAVRLSYRIPDAARNSGRRPR